MRMCTARKGIEKIYRFWLTVYPPCFWRACPLSVRRVYPPCFWRTILR